MSTVNTTASSETVRNAYSNSYCMAKKDGHLCHTRVPVTERFCPECKKAMEVTPQ